MRRLTFLSALFVLLSAPHSFAEPQLQSHELSTGMTVRVFVSDKSDFAKEWLSTPHDHAPLIKGIRKARLNQSLYGGFIVEGFGTKDSAVDLKVSVRVIDPNGNVMFEDPVWFHETGRARSTGFVLIGQSLDFAITSGDPTGTYRIEASVWDGISGQSATGDVTIEVHE